MPEQSIVFVFLINSVAVIGMGKPWYGPFFHFN